ncbi:MAG: ATP-binding protein [Bacteroidota bacterium]
MDSWQEPHTLALYLLIALLLVFTLIVAIIVSVKLSLRKAMQAQAQTAKLKLQHQQKLLENSILAQERERRRIAADIHDELIGKLTAVKLINHVNEDDTKINALLLESIQIARRISHDLMPPLIESTPMEELLKELLFPWQSQIDIHTTFNVIEEVAVDAKIKIHFVRIVQEILMNIIKHSRASQVDFNLRISPLCIAMSIGDNGIGFDLATIKSGLGLSNIETRIQYLKGQYKLKSASKQGTRYVFLIPTLSEKQEALKEVAIKV